MLSSIQKCVEKVRNSRDFFLLQVKASRCSFTYLPVKISDENTAEKNPVLCFCALSFTSVFTWSVSDTAKISCV